MEEKRRIKVKLAKNFPENMSFMEDWNYELIGDKLRAEFDKFFEQKEAEGAVSRGSSVLLKGEAVKEFMLRKQINLVDDPGNQSLKSVFILKHGEEKEIDERAYEALKRFEYRERKDDLGQIEGIDGYLTFTGKPRVRANTADVEVSGEDVDFFAQEEDSDPVVVKKQMFVCSECGKEFDTKMQLIGHMASHGKKKKEAKK